MTTPRVTVPVEPTEAMRLVPDRVLTKTLYWMARAYERVHSMPRVSDTELANKIEDAKADLGRARDASPILSNSAAPAPEGGAVKSMGQRAYENMRDNNDNVSRAMNSNKSWAELSDEERVGWEEDAKERPHLYSLAAREEDHNAFAFDEAGNVTHSTFIDGKTLTFNPTTGIISTREKAPVEAGEDVWETAAKAKGWRFSPAHGEFVHDEFSDRPPSWEDCCDLSDLNTLEAAQAFLAALRAQPPAREDAQPVGFADEVAWLREAARYFSARDTKGEDRAHWANIYNAGNANNLADRLAGLSSNSCQLRRATLAQPVAWRSRLLDAFGDGAWAVTTYRPSADEVQPLYTHPAPDALRVAVEDIDPAVMETALGGSYDMPDGRKFWIDAPVAREMTKRVLAALQAEQGAK